MTSRKFNTGYFVLEALNSVATTYYFFYLFFFMAREFGFRNQENLLLAAANGLVYMTSAWCGGKFGQRFGYFLALRLGFATMALALLTGAFATSIPGHIMVMVSCTLGMGFTWPNLEALVSEKETPSELPRVIGIYNMIWAGMGSIAFFSGGALLEKLGLRSMFWVPVSIQLVQLAFLSWLERRPPTELSPATMPKLASAPALNPRPIARAKMFLRLAWFANPFAYVAINTVVAVVPGIARKLQLSPMLAGFFCSVWLFARLGTFFGLWLWSGWHYRIRWFVAAYVLLIAGFTVIQLGSVLWIVMLAQIAFGMALGLIYYSSLFYSMDVGETKGEHGGIHETVIGLGIFAGPAIGGTTLFLYPQYPNSGALAVAGALLAGFIGLLVLVARCRAKLRPITEDPAPI
jgi:MFS family permease